MAKGACRAGVVKTTVLQKVFKLSLLLKCTISGAHHHPSIFVYIFNAYSFWLFQPSVLSTCQVSFISP